MKWQNFKTQLMVSGIFFATLAALFVQTAVPEETQMKQYRSQTIEIPPTMGHWLRTEKDFWYSPGITVIKKSRQKPENTVPLYSLEQAKSALNRSLDSINIMYIWSDGDRLKVISVTGFNRKTKQAAIVVIPLHTVTNNGNIVNLEDEQVTVQDLYQRSGRDAVRAFLERKFEITIPNFVHVNQPALKKLSDVIGALQVNGDEINMLEAFEQTAAGIRTDDADVVKAVASQVIRPQMLLEIPELLWIFTHDVRTNFSTQQMISLFHISRQMDLGHMCKTTLPGNEYFKGDLKHLFVSEQTWKNIIYEITQ